MPPASALNQHEDRIARVESELRDLTGTVAGLDVKFEYTNRTLESLAEQLKEGFEKVSIGQNGLREKLDEHRSTMTTKVQALEASEERSIARSKLFLGILLAGAGSGAGLLVKWAIERLVG